MSITAKGIACDITDVAGVERFSQQAQEAYGRVDALVVNAAGDPPVGAYGKSRD
ncbi:MAG TPA: SDR family NAD(P)-dependent oxidoreductase [Bryobacteraceae bacterium]|nr:SDR family NAD(P)-dependent oxidoreductase [Bryobacteraceae bacterium]